MYDGRIEDIDWDGIWEQQWRAARKGEGVEHWNRIAAHPTSRPKRDDYLKELLKRIRLLPTDSVLDVGCGSGDLAIPIARRVRTVTALDWSPVMLGALEKNANAAGLENIVPITGDWPRMEVGREFDRHDVVIASRSLPMGGLRQALMKMHESATRACYLTWTVGGSPFEAEVGTILGRRDRPYPSHVMIYNLLHSLGMCPSVEIFDVSGSIRFDSLDAAADSILKGETVDSESLTSLRTYLSERLERKRGSFYRHASHRWALIWWRVER